MGFTSPSLLVRHPPTDLDDKDEVKSREDGGLKVDVLLGGLQVIIPERKFVGQCIKRNLVVSKWRMGRCFMLYGAIFLPPAHGGPVIAQSLTSQPLSHLPEGGLAAARTDVRDLSMVVMPALAMEMVCCSMACSRGIESCKECGTVWTLFDHNTSQFPTPRGWLPCPRASSCRTHQCKQHRCRPGPWPRPRGRTLGSWGPKSDIMFVWGRGVWRKE